MAFSPSEISEVPMHTLFIRCGQKAAVIVIIAIAGLHAQGKDEGPVQIHERYWQYLPRVDCMANAPKRISI